MIPTTTRVAPVTIRTVLRKVRTNLQSFQADEETPRLVGRSPVTRTKRLRNFQAIPRPATGPL